MVLLTRAVRDGRTNQVKLLLKAGINVNLADEKGQTALIHCCFLQDYKVRMTILKLLAATGMDASKRDKFGRGVVSWACVYARTDILTFLLNDTAFELDFNTVDNDGNTSILLAVMSGSLEMVKLVLMMVTKTSSVDQIHRSNNAGICPLLAAFRRGDKKCAQLLIKEGGAPISSVLKYVQEQEEIDPAQSHPIYDFMAKSHDPVVSLSDNPKVASEKDILQFLFTKDDNPRPARVNKSRTSLDLKKKSNMFDFSSTKSTIGLKNGRYSRDLPDITDSISEIDMTSQSLDATARISESKYYSSHESVLQLYDLYKEQLTPSYREGLPKCRYRTPTPPPPPRKESRSYRKNSIQNGGYLSPKRGSLSSSSGSNLLLQESALDRQIRMKYARSNRAASMQAAKLPPIPAQLRKLKKTKSSTSLKI